MNLISDCSVSQRVALTVLVAGGSFLAVMTGCTRSPEAPAPVPAAAKPAAEDASGEVRLTAEEAKAMEIETTAAVAMSHVPEAAGFGIVLAHDTLAQSVADLATALAAKRQSQAALERTKRLAGTPGAMGADAQEAAERQAIVDTAALELATQRASSVWGENPPWKNKGINDTLSAIARGQSKLVRVTFPLGAIGDEVPQSLRLARMESDQARPHWQSTSVWAAPADANVPGMSFFALLTGTKVHEGERLAVWAPVGAAQRGVLIPAAGVVISNSKYWFYAQIKPHLYRRIELDASMPTGVGYFVTQGVAAGVPVVTNSAGLLLARETSPSAAAD